MNSSEWLEHIDPEDANYEEELRQAAQSFQTFEAAFDGFLREQGYVGNLEDAEEKLRFLQTKYAEAGMELNRRAVRDWFKKQIRASKRTIAFQMCFAFHLNLEETQDFFRTVYLQRGIDCHDSSEMIYYYAIDHGLSWQKAQELIAQAPPVTQKEIPSDSKALFTGTIQTALEQFQDESELLDFLWEHQDQFGYRNVTARRQIRLLWKEISGAGGLADQELQSDESNKESKRELRTSEQEGSARSAWDIFRQLFFFYKNKGIEEDAKELENIYRSAGDRTYAPIFRDNPILHPLAAAEFPGRQGIEKILRGEEKVTYETIRKMLILLLFYRYWTKKRQEFGQSYYEATIEDREEWREETESYLEEAGFATLYAGNPYDWIFLYAAQCDDPLWTLRDFLMTVYTEKQNVLRENDMSVEKNEGR